ncbi:MAG: UvrD-helicase domain-containing protein [Pirellulales bacterium]
MEFNDEQIRAIECTARHLLVLAGAGTGKTRTIIEPSLSLDSAAAVRQIASPSLPSHADANEIKARLSQSVGDARKGIVAGSLP